MRNELIKRFPTMESLFGSMDFCECEHCRSVLSPAAYLVDLLEFVDAEPGVWGNALGEWKKTHGWDYPHKDRTEIPRSLIMFWATPPRSALHPAHLKTHTRFPTSTSSAKCWYYVANGKLEEKLRATREPPQRNCWRSRRK
jgi:hypothetical protein